MSARARLRLAARPLSWACFAACLAACLSACLSACGPPDPMGGCESGYYDGAPTESLVLGETLAGTFTPLVSGGDIHFVWGLQGGTMILPSIELSPSIAGSSRCARVELSNLPDPAFPGEEGEIRDFPGYTRNANLYEVDGVLRTVAFEDQVGWGAPSGVRMILGATLRGPDYAASASLPLRVVDEGGFDMCDELPTTGGGGGCEYRLIAGTGTVTALEPQAGAPCSDGVTLAYSFAPEDPAHAECYSDSGFPLAYGGGRFLSRACVEEAGIGVGSTFPVTWSQIVGGTCTPALQEETVDLDTCAARCVG